MNIARVNPHILCCCLLIMIIALQAFLLFLSKDTLPWKEKRTIETIIAEEAYQKDIPEAMYEFGYYLYIRGQYNEADQILRYIATKGNEDPGWFDWNLNAQSILLSDKFQAFYQSGVVVSNTFYVVDIDDLKLFDQESVRRKYGEPSEVVKPTKEFCGERWIYSHRDGHALMTFEFNNGRLFHMRAGSKSIGHWNCSGMVQGDSADGKPTKKASDLMSGTDF